MRNQFKIIILLIVNTVLFTSCNNNEVYKQENIIRNCLKEIINPDPKSIDSCYLVNPYLNSFTFSNFTSNNYKIDEFTFKNKKKVLKKLNISEEYFNQLRNDLDKKNLKKYYSNLEDLSKGNKSHKLVTFSGASENLIFVEIITFCDILNKKDLKEKNLYYSKNKIINVTSLAIILQNEKVKEVTVDGGADIEMFGEPCSFFKE